MAQSLAQFGQTIKAKHPEYGDMADEDVANKVLAKYPQYRDMVETVAGAGPLGLPQPKNPTVDMQPSSSMVPAALAAGDVGLGALKGAGRTANNIGKLLIPDAALKAAGVAPPGRSTPPVLQPTNTAQKIGGGLEQAGEFFIPGGAEEAAYAKLAPYVGKAAPLLKAGLAGLGAGTVNKAQGGSFTTGALAGGIGSGVTQGIAATAPAWAESALKVTGNDKTYGRTVGRAILDDTRGIRPGTVESTGRETVNALRPEMEQIAADAGANGSRGSLLPARDAVGQTTARHTTNRAVNSASELNPLQNFLQNDAVTGLPLSPTQTPTGLLQLKRGVDSDFIGSWNPNSNSDNQLQTAKQVYRQLADQFHTAAPGTAGIDQRISSLIPVLDRAQRAERGAGILENTMNRFRTPTGALAGAIAGGAGGYGHNHSLSEAAAGALFGAVAPGVMAAPSTQMFIARAANAAPLATPLLNGIALQVPRLYAKPKNEDK